MAWRSKYLALPIVIATLLLKPFADLFWQFNVLDGVLLCILVLGCMAGATRRDAIMFGVQDLPILGLFILYLSAGFNHPSAIVTLIKVLSGLFLYLVGRMNARWMDVLARGLTVTMAVVVGINLLLFAGGRGFQQWGHASTFSGAYFFKTDLASAMGLAMVCGLYYAKSAKTRGLMVLASASLILFSNTRAYYIAILVELLIFWLYRRGFRVSFQTLVYSSLAGAGAIGVVAWLMSLEFFRRFGFIGFDLDASSGLISAANTQGRSEIWRALWERYLAAGPLDMLFGLGLGLGQDEIYLNGTTWSSHSLYFGVLIAVGAVGVLMLVGLVAVSFGAIFGMTDRRSAYFILSLLVMMLVSGISVNTIEFTASTWLLMFFLGAAISIERQPSQLGYCFDWSPSEGGYRTRVRSPLTEDS